jgi:hypothetical protein
MLSRTVATTAGGAQGASCSARQRPDVVSHVGTGKCLVSRQRVPRASMQCALGRQCSSSDCKMTTALVPARYSKIQPYVVSLCAGWAGALAQPLSSHLETLRATPIPVACGVERGCRSRRSRLWGHQGGPDAKPSSRAPCDLVLDERRLPQARERHPVGRVLEAGDVEHKRRVRRRVVPTYRREVPGACARQQQPSARVSQRGAGGGPGGVRGRMASRCAPV